ncbi:MAG: hypothetical protein JWQ40_3118 [Segetibacter sp.]|nr:hypothetical protein [Segetibacter sp.]
MAKTINIVRVVIDWIRVVKLPAFSRSKQVKKADVTSTEHMYHRLFHSVTSINVKAAFSSSTFIFSSPCSISLTYRAHNSLG